MKKLLGALFVLTFVLLTLRGQGVHPEITQDSGSGAPVGTCWNQTYVDSTTGDFYTCGPSGWNKVGVSGTIPSGVIVFIDAGSCPSGFTEDTTFSGAYVLGTVAANGNVGTTGGSNSYTPAGTNSSPSVSATGTKMSTSGSGTASLTAFNGTTMANGTGNTLTIPSQIFTGTLTTIQPSFIRVIACKKN